VADNIDNLILEHLKRFQAGQERIERELREIKARLSTLEAGQGSVLQHIGHLTSSIAAQQVSIDHLHRMQVIGVRSSLEASRRLHDKCCIQWVGLEHLWLDRSRVPWRAFDKAPTPA